MPLKAKSSKHSPLHLALPATSANLGPAFDAAALACNIYIKISALVAASFAISATGRDREICGKLEGHLILTTYAEVLQSQGREVTPLQLRIHNDIPIGKGCGSSAAARVAGIALANHFGGLRWTDAQVVGEASRREHHPDNASACWWGGLTVARMTSESEAQVVSVNPKGKWPLLLAVPEEALATEEARRVLPAQYSRADAVANVQNSMLLLAAFMQGRPELLSAALEDRMHQPFRAPLCPLLPCMQKWGNSDEILGTALSGAGPSVLIFVNPKASMSKVKKNVAVHLKRNGLTAELLSAAITPRGARNS